MDFAEATVSATLPDGDSRQPNAGSDLGPLEAENRGNA
jgi:hypothetical protein